MSYLLPVMESSNTGNDFDKYFSKIKHTIGASHLALMTCEKYFKVTNCKKKFFGVYFTYIQYIYIY